MSKGDPLQGASESAPSERAIDAANVPQVHEWRQPVLFRFFKQIVSWPVFGGGGDAFPRFQHIDI